MFSKVLVADDLGSIHTGVSHLLENLGVTQTVQEQYCDTAYLQIKKASKTADPFQLLITDLSFKADHRKQQLTSGDALAERIRMEHPEVKIIVYSVEDRFQRVRQLYSHLGIDAFVCKGRHGVEQLTEALHLVAHGNRFLSPQIAMALSPKTDLEIDEYDLQLLTLLSYGYSQEEISTELKSTHTSPNSLSSIEKKINKLKIQFDANNAIHLVALVKDLGLI